MKADRIVAKLLETDPDMPTKADVYSMVWEPWMQRGIDAAHRKFLYDMRRRGGRTEEEAEQLWTIREREIRQLLVSDPDVRAHVKQIVADADAESARLKSTIDDVQAQGMAEWDKMAKQAGIKPQ
jgi:hypothetical protein